MSPEDGEAWWPFGLGNMPPHRRQGLSRLCRWGRGLRRLAPPEPALCISGTVPRPI